MILKVEHCGFHATFLDLAIAINNGKISTKQNDICDDCSFFIVVMSKFHNNILTSICYGTVVSEIISIARSSLSVVSIYEKSNALITRIEKQGYSRWIWITHFCLWEVNTDLNTDWKKKSFHAINLRDLKSQSAWYQ